MGWGGGGITYVPVILMNTYYRLIVKIVCNDNGKRFLWNVRDNDIMISVYQTRKLLNRKASSNYKNSSAYWNLNSKFGKYFSLWYLSLSVFFIHSKPQTTFTLYQQTISSLNHFDGELLSQQERVCVRLYLLVISCK